MLLKEHAEVLADIQRSLIDNEHDRVDISGQAAPVYYGIIDREEVMTCEGNHDFVKYFYKDSGSPLDQDAINLLIEEYMDFMDEEDEDWARLHWDEEFDEIEKCYMTYRDLIVPSCMFLTREEAKLHLRENYYHYTDWAHTYAMTAWRSPQYELLLKVLHEADFGYE